MALLSCEDLTLGYGAAKVAEHLSFEVNEGDYLCIVGENGSGKSTLMKTCLGLLRPVAGRVVFGDGLKAAEIGYLPQQTSIQKDFPASCKEIVRSGCLNQCGWRPFYTRKERQKAAYQIERMGITHLSKRCYSELSGGQQQRVLLARALCATKKLLLLDEPAAGLDPKVTVELYTLIRKLNHSGITVMMVTHDIPGAMQYATHILHIGKQNYMWGTNEAYQKSAFALSGCMQAQEVAP